MIRIVRILVIAALMTFFLGQMIADRMALLREGKVVELEVTPVDPRSLFRGDYVILNYAISTIDILPLEGDTGFDADDKVFITLVFNGSAWEPVAAHKETRQVKADEVLISGRVKWARTRKCIAVPGTSEPDCRAVEELQITYGIESFFVPEGVGRELEDQRNEGKMRVRVAVDESGRAGIKSLLIDGKVVYEETLF